MADPAACGNERSLLSARRVARGRALARSFSSQGSLTCLAPQPQKKLGKHRSAMASSQMALVGGLYGHACLQGLRETSTAAYIVFILRRPAVNTTTTPWESASAAFIRPSLFPRIAGDAYRDSALVSLTTTRARAGRSELKRCLRGGSFIFFESCGVRGPRTNPRLAQFSLNCPREPAMAMATEPHIGPVWPHGLLKHALAKAPPPPPTQHHSFPPFNQWRRPS